MNSQFERRNSTHQNSLDISILSSGSYDRDGLSSRRRHSSQVKSGAHYTKGGSRNNATRNGSRNARNVAYDAASSRYLRGTVNSRPRSRKDDIDVSVFDFDDFEDRRPASPRRPRNSRPNSRRTNYQRSGHPRTSYPRTQRGYNPKAAPPRRRRRKSRRKHTGHKFLVVFEIIVIIGVMMMLRPLFDDTGGIKILNQIIHHAQDEAGVKDVQVPDWVDVQYIDKEGNESRPGTKLDGVNDIVIHYVGNPGTTAQQNRDFFNQKVKESDVSSHFVVGMDGKIIQCIPLNERSVASNHRNHDTISIEVCHPDTTGKFTDASYQATIKLVDWLMEEYHLNKDHVIRHHDVSGKECPKYFVDNPEAWEQFKNDL